MHPLQYPWIVAIWPHHSIRPVVQGYPDRPTAEMSAATLRRLTLLKTEVIFNARPWIH